MRPAGGRLAKAVPDKPVPDKTISDKAIPDQPAFCKVAGPLETLPHVVDLAPTKHSGNTIVGIVVERGAQT